MSKNQTEYIRADRYEKLKARYLELWEAHRTALPPELVERVRAFVDAGFQPTGHSRAMRLLTDILSAIGESEHE
jgi:hypothetical protein